MNFVKDLLLFVEIRSNVHVNGATCEQELNMADKSTTSKRKSAEAALDKDDECLQEEIPTKKIKDIVEDEEELDEAALLGNSDGEENTEGEEELDEDALLGNSDGEENPEGTHEELNAQVDASEGLEASDHTGDVRDIVVPDDSLVNDLNMTSENQSVASQPSMTASISSTLLTTPKSEKPKPSPPREEETSEEGEEEDIENDLEQTKGNTQDTEETSESEDGRGGRSRSERQTVTDSLKSSRTRDIFDTLGTSVEAQKKMEEFERKIKEKEHLMNITAGLGDGHFIRDPPRGVSAIKPLMSSRLQTYQQRQHMSESYRSDELRQYLQLAFSSGPPHASFQGWQALKAKDDCRMVKLFDICYHLAKQELPFSSYPSSVDLEIRHGVELGRTYQSTVHAHTFTEFLAEDIREKVDEAVREARYMSILIDGSTDRSTSGKELMYVKYLEDGIPRTRFFSILEVKSANADGILEAINTTFQQHNIPDWEKKLIGICADGASVKFRCQKGVIARLAVEIPWLLDIRCIAHQLELASKNAFKNSFFSKEIDPFLTSLAKFVQSPLADGTLCWVDERKRDLKRLSKIYLEVVAHLTAIGMDKRSKFKDVAAKARGMVKKMSSYKFVLHMALYIDLLEELSHLSFELQQNDICLSTAREHLGTAKSALTEIAGGRNGVKLQSIKNSCVKGIYQGVPLSGMEDGSAEFDATLYHLVQPLVRCIGQRFSSFTEIEVFSALLSLDPKTWPNDLTGFDFRNRDARILIEHFNDTLVAHGCDPDEAYSEWLRLKKVIPFYYEPTITWQALWGTLFQKHQAEFPNFLHIIEMILVLPFATEKVERGFSLMNRMKSDWRVRLNSCELDDLMMISLEGPSEEEYDTSSAVARWRRAVKKSRRLYVQP